MKVGDIVDIAIGDARDTWYNGPWKIEHMNDFECIVSWAGSADVFGAPDGTGWKKRPLERVQKFKKDVERYDDNSYSAVEQLGLAPVGSTVLVKYGSHPPKWWPGLVIKVNRKTVTVFCPDGIERYKKPSEYLLLDKA